MPKQANEKWILTVKELHLGHCKETFRAGAVIELDEANGRLIIDGRRFNDTRDLDVLKRQAERYPDNPWIIPYSDEARNDVVNSVAPVAMPVGKTLRADQKLKIIQSDQDLSEDIDISDTKVSKVNAKAKAEVKERVAQEGMEIIRGDESVEDRLARLKGKTDISSIAERARLKATGSVAMPIVKDDSLGAGFTGKSAVALNAGQHLPSREEAESRKSDALAQANARKKEAEMRHQSQEGEDASGASEEASGGDSVALETTSVTSGNDVAEIKTLRDENAALKAQIDRIEKMMVAQQAAAPRRGRKTTKVGE